MPLWYHVDSIERLLVITGEGTLTQEERLAAMQTWLRDPDYVPGLNTLLDVSAATSVPSMAELRQLIVMMNRHAAAIGRKRLAIVAARPITFGVARQFQVLAEQTAIAVQVFSMRADAMAWLKDSNVADMTPDPTSLPVDPDPASR